MSALAQGNSAIIASAGNLVVQGCDFQKDGPQVRRRALLRIYMHVGVGGSEHHSTLPCCDALRVPQVELGAGVSKAIILGNLFKGATRITNKASAGNVQVGYNADG